MKVPVEGYATTVANATHSRPRRIAADVTCMSLGGCRLFSTATNAFSTVPAKAVNDAIECNLDHPDVASILEFPGCQPAFEEGLADANFTLVVVGIYADGPPPARALEALQPVLANARNLTLIGDISHDLLRQAWEPLGNLRNLTVTENSVFSHIDRQTFTGLSSLEDLKISDCVIDHMAEDTFVDLRGL